MQSLASLVRDQNIKSAWISGLGGAEWAELGFYHLQARHYQWRRFDEPLEITAIQGNIARQNGQPVLHMHGTFTKNTFEAIGGHIKELEVSGTCELHLHTVFGEDLRRSHDQASGLDLLDI